MSRYIVVLNDTVIEGPRPYLVIDAGGVDRGPEVVCEATNYWGDQIAKALNLAEDLAVAPKASVTHCPPERTLPGGAVVQPDGWRKLVVDTSRAGEIECEYGELVHVLGPPITLPYGPDGKCDVYWVICWPDGVVATLYNYKDGPAYCGDEGTPVEEITDWHVGAHSALGNKSAAWSRVADLIGAKP